MTTTLFTLVPSKYMEAAQTVQYTVDSPQTGAVVAVIDAATISNPSPSVVTFSVSLVDGDDLSGTQTVPTREIQPGETYLCPELLAQVLSEGSYISTLCDTAEALVIRITGRLIT